MVSSTGSSQTYNYHKILAAETDVKQLSDDINDFNARYRVGSSNPTSALDGGDLFFNTGSSKLLVYNNTSSAWEEAQSIGNFFISTFSEAFDGSRIDFTLSNAPANAQQVILSINGVIQKPNAGSSRPSEGFSLNGSTLQLPSGTGPANGTDYFVIVMGSTVNIGTPSDGTVDTDVLTSGAVTTIKIADDAVTADKIANSVNSAIAANTAKTTNATHTGEVTGDTALTIADNVVDEANLKVSNSPTNGYLLSAQSGNTGGLTWVASPSSDLVDDTSPQLGGTLESNGNEIHMDDGNQIEFGTGNDLKIFHSSDTNLIESHNDRNLEIKAYTNGASETQAKFIPNGAVELYHNNSKKFETLSTGIDITGACNADSLNINSSLSANGALVVKLASNKHIGFNPNQGEVGSVPAIVAFQDNGSLAEIGFRGVDVRFAAGSAERWRIDTSGHWKPGANNTYDIGTSSVRVRNIYTNDLHLSNEGHSNDVDGSWGNWTIQEGESDLFLKNNRSGKKYKFNLTEVS